MSLLVYKLLHITGLLMVFVAFGGSILHAYNGGSSDSNAGRKLVAITHGVGLLLLLISGFGMLARLGFGMPPVWAWLKLGVWLILGGALVAVRKMPQHATGLWWGVVLLGVLAGYLALFKPIG